MVKLFAPYQYDADEVSRETGLLCADASLTQQQFRDEADINYIMERFGQTGELPSVQAPQYGDYSEVFDYQSAMNQVVAAQAAFMALPAATRARFGNDPAQLLAFCEDASNRAEAVKLGLVFDQPVTVPEGTGAPEGGQAQSST